MTTKTSPKTTAAHRSLAAFRAHLTMATRAVSAAKNRKTKADAAKRVAAIKTRMNEFLRANRRVLSSAAVRT